MKPFDLQKFLAGEPITTLGRHKIVAFRYDTNFEDIFPLKIALKENTGLISNFQYSIDGSPLGSINPDYYLCMEEPEIWVNVYHSKVRDEAWCSRFYESEKEAKENIIEGNYQTTIKLKS